MSAVAARKAAALAAQAAHQLKTGIIAISSSPSSPSPSFVTTSTHDSSTPVINSPLPSHASSSTQDPSSSGKRKRKLPQPQPSSSLPTTPLRESSQTPLETINIDASDDDAGIDIPIPGEEYEQGLFTPELIAPSGRPKKRRRIEPNEAAASISTFQPQKGVNYFSFTQEEVERALDACASGEAGLVGLKRAKGIVIALTGDETLIISGTVLLTPLRSSISIFSTSISPSTHPGSHAIYAPLTHPLPVLTPTPHSSSGDDHPILSRLPLPRSFLSPLNDETTQPRTMFLLQALQSGLEGIANGPVTGLGRIWPEGKAGMFGLEGCFPVLHHPGYPIYQHLTSPTWSTALSSFLPYPSQSSLDSATHSEPESDLAQPLIALIKGPKRSGKSTFAREALNGLLGVYEKVAYLDCDLGQSEFGCGGLVGLYVLDRPILGPSFSHPASPIRSHFIGALNPRLLPQYYITSISSLLEHYRYEVQYPGTTSTSSHTSSKIKEVVPLIINTQGWVKGLGADLLAQIEGMAQPTHTFAFVEGENEYGAREGGDGGNGFRQPSFGGSSYEVVPEEEVEVAGGNGITYSLEAIPVSPLLSKYSPAELRTLSTISHMHAILPNNVETTRVTCEWNFSLPLVAKRPWTIDLAQAIKEIYLVGEGADGVLEEDVGLALNGSVVGLLERVDAVDAVDTAARYVPSRILPHPDTVNCLGIGLIRAVSPDDTKIQLLTSLSPETFSRISIIVKGELELPLVGLIDWRETRSGVIGSNKTDEGMMGLPWAEVPFLTTVEGEQGVGMAKKRFRRNLMRKNQGP